jgi:hypothetical protein
VTRKALWLAVGVVLLTNAAALGVAWLNRSGASDAELVLTEREVRLLPRETENTAVGLRLEWVDPTAEAPASTWFDAGRLARLGFDCGVPVTRENARFYRGQAPRSAYAAFEFEGEAWQRYLASVQGDAVRESAVRGSHLVFVDVDLDPSALRARHPDRRRVIIVHATVGLRFRDLPRAAPFLAGHLDRAYPIEVSVAKHLRGALDELVERPRVPFDPTQSGRGTPLPGEPRFQATIRWGRYLEPWLVALQLSPTKLSGKNSFAEPQQ